MNAIATADVIVVGAGVQGASLAFHLARRGASVLVLERAAVAAGATGRSSGFVRMHYDLELEARLAWASYPYFAEWAGRVGEGDAGFVRTGFLQLVPASVADALRANVAAQQRIGIPTDVVGPAEVSLLVPGIVTEDVVAAAYEPHSGYADPTGTTAGFLAGARRAGARFIGGCRVSALALNGERVVGVESDRGGFQAPVVVIAGGAWSAELAATAGVTVPVEAWRHDTAYFGLPEGRSADLPIVIDHAQEVYFRPEGRDLLLVGLEAGNVIGGSPDRPMAALAETTVEVMVERVCRRLPWMAAGTFRTAHGGQDGITPDQRAILGPVSAGGPDGLWLACGFSGTGFKIAPAVGASLAEWILDGRPSTVDITPFALSRFVEGRPLVGEHPYEALWR
ncbi:MAG: FAD-binding oxidoreductase [Candidatus Limnocylindrales bacterium]|nr:FAD-binding oxidoreductase [Candidatus Limnocylindrales bacterium]